MGRKDLIPSETLWCMTMHGRGQAAFVETMSSLHQKNFPLPRCRTTKPESFVKQVRSMHPLNPNGWICFEADSIVRQEPGHPEGVKQILPYPSSCPVCLKEANLCCRRCTSVYYCSKTCQKQHWRLSHKQACCPNPKRYSFNTSLDQFRGLPDKYFEGHEFIIIKPTEKLASITDICGTALEDCDDVCNIEGFGTNQIDALWVPTNQNDPMAHKVRTHFGWTSGAYGVERMEGYRPVEDLCVYMVLFDDSFQNPAMSPGLETSYYGAGCFALPEGKQCRGNVVIFRLMITKKAWKSQKIPREARFLFQLSDDANFEYEYEMYPICKAEVAQMLQERTKALEQGAFTRRTWRSHIRRIELPVEVSKSTTRTVVL